MLQTIILCPLYQDEASFNIFAAEVEKEVAKIPRNHFSFLVINDGTDNLRLSTMLPLTLMHLHRNGGHQKAIAIGLAYAHQHLNFDHIIIMDCDGEDKPEDISQLLSAAKAADTIVVAQRAGRDKGKSFKMFYYLYKQIFFLLTGKRIAFGNFLLLSKKQTEKIVHYSEMWNHLAGAIIKSKLPYSSVNLSRGKRYADYSKMNFTTLLLHALGAIGVFIEVVASRLLIFSFFMVFISVVAILIILFIKLFTTLGIPGWATTALSSMIIVLLQSFLLSLFTLFLYLSFQGQRKFIPALHYEDYVRTIETFNHG